MEEGRGGIAVSGEDPLGRRGTMAGWQKGDSGQGWRKKGQGWRGRRSGLSKWQAGTLSGEENSPQFSLPILYLNVDFLSCPVLHLITPNKVSERELQWDIKSYNKDDHNFRVQRRNHIYHTSSSLANKLLIIDSQGSWRGLCGSGSPSPTQPSISSLILYVITYLSFPVKTTNLVFRKYSVELHWMFVTLSSLPWLVLSRLHENLLEEKLPGNSIVPSK